MKTNHLFLIAFWGILLTSCGTQKKIIHASGEITKQPIHLFWENYTQQLPSFDALQINANVDASLNKKNINANLRIYIETEKQIWLNASIFGFTGARGLIKPNSVKAYEIIDKSFVDTDFDYINKIFHVDFIDYTKLQQLLLGQIPLLSDLKDYDFKSDKETKEYILSYKNNQNPQKKDYRHSYFLDSDYRLKKIEIISPQDNTQVIATYDDWVKIDNKNLPSIVKILIKAKELSSIELDYNKFTFEQMTPPFKIPSGYSKRDLK